MTSGTIIAILAFIVVAILAVTAWSVARRGRTTALRHHFGLEYDRALQAHSSRQAAERELRERNARMQGVPIRSFRPEEKEQYAVRWHDIQAKFVDDPKEAVLEADTLVGEAMQAVGYPAGPFEIQAGNLSVDHPTLANAYRAAHEAASTGETAEGTRDDLRHALLQYRDVVAELLDVQRIG